MLEIHYVASEAFALTLENYCVESKIRRRDVACLGNIPATDEGEI
jgi:hypothetical protein